MKLYFSDFFEVRADELKRYGAFNVSLVADLPLFIDPFLLFNSRRPEYRRLHEGIIDYLRFLKQKSNNQQLESGLIKALYRFSEVNQTWLGFTEKGNRGRGLGTRFAISLHRNLGRLFTNFGAESLTKGSHLEKLCLIEEGVGRDNISDFTTNLIKEFLLQYTERFANRTNVLLLMPQLEEGEAEGITQAQEKALDRIILDEKKARAVAANMGIQPIGVARLLFRLERDGQIENATKLIGRLKKELRFRISEELVHEARAKAEEPI